MVAPDYDRSNKIDKVTGLPIVEAHFHFGYVLFDGSVSIPAGATAISDWVDVTADKEFAIYIKTTNNCTVQVQFTDTDEATENPDAFDYCGSNGAAITWTFTFSPGRAIPVSCKGMRMRVAVKNNGATEDTPYVGAL